MLTVLDAEEERGSYTKFLRAQSLLYRGVLKDRSASGTDIERAVQLFSEVEKEQPELALQARFQRARAHCVMAKVLKDETKGETYEFRKAMANKGRAILKTMPDFAKQVRRRISTYLSNQIDGERRGCVAAR